MADLTLKGNLNLVGDLSLNPDGGKVLIGDAGQEALVQLTAPGDPEHSTAPPVIMPPPPGSPVDAGPKVWVINSFNQTVVAGSSGKPLVALGLVMQGNTPTWPGSVLPGQNSTVMANFLPINVVNDQAIVFPSGGPAVFSASGQ